MAKPKKQPPSLTTQAKAFNKRVAELEDRVEGHDDDLEALDDAYAEVRDQYNGVGGAVDELIKRVDELKNWTERRDDSLYGIPPDFNTMRNFVRDELWRRKQVRWYTRLRRRVVAWVRPTWLAVADWCRENPEYVILCAIGFLVGAFTPWGFVFGWIFAWLVVAAVEAFVCWRLRRGAKETADNYNATHPMPKAKPTPADDWSRSAKPQAGDVVTTCGYFECKHRDRYRLPDGTCSDCGKMVGKLGGV